MKTNSEIELLADAHAGGLQSIDTIFRVAVARAFVTGYNAGHADNCDVDDKREKLERVHEGDPVATSGRA